MSKPILLLLTLLILLFATTAGGVLATHEEVRKYLKIDSSIGIVPDNVQRAVVEQLPIGTSKSQVATFLSAQGIGRDEGSVCGERRGGEQLVCDLGTDHHSWELVRDTYTVAFGFSPGGKLQTVSVKAGLSWKR